MLNSVLSKGVESMNQPLPLASPSIRMLPSIRSPWESYFVIWSSASCPVGRSLTIRLMSKGVWGKRREFQKVCAVELIVKMDAG